MTLYSYCALALVSAAAVHAAQAENKLAFFEKNVRPVLVNRCYACHSADTKPAGGLRVDDRNGLLHGPRTAPPPKTGLGWLR